MEKTYQVKDVSVAARQIYILSLLSENPMGYTAEEICEKLKKWDIVISKRTVMRDIDELSESYGICEEERNDKIFYYADKYNLKNVDLTVSDLMSIAFMQSLLADYLDTDMGKTAAQMLQKIADNTAVMNQLHLQAIGHTIKNLDGRRNKNQNINPVIEKQISNAIEKQNKIMIIYHGFTANETTTRTIHPYAFLMNDGYLSVEAYCEMRKDMRTFRLSRIEDVTVTDYTFEKNEEYKKQENNNRQFMHMRGDVIETLVVAFEGEAARFVLEYEKDLADHIERNQQEIIFTKHTAITREVKKWILGYGAEAKVIEPAWLVKELKDEICSMSRQYEKK